MSPYVSQSPETEEWADRLLFEHWGGMTPAEKVAAMRSLQRSAHELAVRGEASRHPEASPRELELRLAVRRLGPDVVEQILGHPLPFDIAR